MCSEDHTPHLQGAHDNLRVRARVEHQSHHPACVAQDATPQQQIARLYCLPIRTTVSQYIHTGTITSTGRQINAINTMTSSRRYIGSRSTSLNHVFTRGVQKFPSCIKNIRGVDKIRPGSHPLKQNAKRASLACAPPLPHCFFSRSTQMTLIQYGHHVWQG